MWRLTFVDDHCTIVRGKHEVEDVVVQLGGQALHSLSRCSHELGQ